MAFRAVALALALGAASAGPGGGTYPPGVSYNKLTAETFNDFVEGAIADGKTAMVRWIASEG
jgi:ABC-type sugar transport system substrate-binding protein